MGTVKQLEKKLMKKAFPKTGCMFCGSKEYSVKIKDYGEGNIKVYKCKKCGREDIEIAII